MEPEGDVDADGVNGPGPEDDGAKTTHTRIAAPMTSKAATVFRGTGFGSGAGVAGVVAGGVSLGVARGVAIAVAAGVSRWEVAVRVAAS